MPQIANIIINDGQATPVARTFAVQRAQVGDDSPAEFYEKTAGSINGYLRLSVLTRRAKVGNSFKTQIKIALPVLETVSGTSPTGYAPAPSLAYTSLATVEFTHPERSTLQNRKDLLAFVANVLDESSMVSLVTNAETFY